MKSAIAVFDYKVTRQNPVGKCHLEILQHLCREHDFTVFAVEFENPNPERIRWVKIPAPRRPLVLLFAVFHLLALVRYWGYLLRQRTRFSLVQCVESNLAIGDLAYSQFCHRTYLKRYWRHPAVGGLRVLLRWLDHWAHSLLEPVVYKRVRHIVVPSAGLARELAAEYPYTRAKVRIVGNPIDSARMKPPPDFDRTTFRSRLGISESELALVFVALGHFERKGLPLLFDALHIAGDPRLKLIVVGGEAGLVSAYRARRDRLNLVNRVVFVGMQADVRPYYWAADAFVLPSAYETFSLATFEAAAAGVPVVVSQLNGVEEFLADGRNGLLIERTPQGLAQGIRRLLSLSPAERALMGARAQSDVEKYATLQFVRAWRELYDELAGARSPDGSRSRPDGGTR